jgi:hypothetical protein
VLVISVLPLRKDIATGETALAILITPSNGETAVNDSRRQGLTLAARRMENPGN